MIVGYVLGLIAGFAIVFLHRSTSGKSLLARIALSLVCGFGLGLLLSQPMAALLGQ